MNVLDSEGAGVAGATVRVKAIGSGSEPVYTAAGGVLVKEQVEHSAVTTGLVTFTLIANADLVPSNSYYRVTVQAPSERKPKVFDIQVPDGAGPYNVTAILHDPGTIETSALAAHKLSVADHADVDLTGNAAGKVLMWDGTNFVPADTVATDIEAASLVTAHAALTTEDDDAHGSKTYADAGDAASLLVAAADVTARLAGDETVTGEWTFERTSAPSLVGTLTGTELDRIAGIAVVGKYAYAVAETACTFSVIDVSDPTAPVLVSSITDALLTGGNGPVQVAVVGSYAYVPVQFTDSFLVIDISDPSDPTIVGSVTDAVMDSPYGVAISGHHAFVTIQAGGVNGGVQVIDISDPVSPVIIGSVTDAVMGNARGIALQGKYAFVCSGTGDTFGVVDVSDPTVPTLVTSITDATLLNGARGVDIVGRYAYTTAQTGDSFSIIDIKDPTAPVIVGSLTEGGAGGRLNGARKVVVVGKLAFVSAGDNDSLSVIDVSDPTAPAFVSTLTGLDHARDMAISGRYLYLGTSDSDTFNVLDIGGTDTSAAHIGSLEVDELRVTKSALVGGDVAARGSIGGASLLGKRELSLFGTYADRPEPGVEGRMYRTTDNPRGLWQDTGSLWVPAGDLIVKRTTDSAAKTDTALADDTELRFPVRAGEEWLINLYLRVGAANNTQDMNLKWNLPTATTGDWSGVGPTSVGWSTWATATTAVALTDINSAFPVGTRLGNIGIQLRAQMAITNDGEVVLQWAQNTLDAGELKMLNNALLKLRQL